MENRRVVVTGLGVVSSIGIGKEEFWRNLIAGKSGISEVELFDTSDYHVHVGGEVKNFKPIDFIPRNRLKGMARASQFVVAATKIALQDANIDLDEVKKKKIGIIIGTTMADIQSLEQIDKYWTQKGEDDIWPINIIKYPGNALSDHIGYFFDITGPNYTIPTACSAGNYSIGYSFDLIKLGKVDMMIAGGADPFSRITFTGFNRLYAMAPEKCQPFDKNRKGMMVGEGSGIMILELLEHALKRKANIYAEVLGYALSCDAHHMTAPSVEGIVQVMKKSIKNSGIDMNDIDYISAHGTGTPANDKAECAAVKEVFGPKYKEIPMSSIKSMLGHTMGAASAIEAIVCCLAIKESTIPPTINYETKDPECDIDCVPNKARKDYIRVALNNSLAFGGNDACLVLQRYE
ncbi:MAG: beta-ketoacyl-[acyl-carrier-protein] synthase family protein [Candidatus Taylorbacteria bacterium]|nr:beta-ketoacyl-[acyl-carrier-protein] synthase family protein [Candidatus Taylorbacteria bacterium]